MPAFVPEQLLPAFAPYAHARRCWLAYSGGVDSEALLHALASLRAHVSWQLGAIHVDHGLHPDSAAWAAHCRRSCARLGVPLLVRELRLARRSGASLEALAREARYRALRAPMRVDDLLLTAQHRDDQAETVLLALLRGSGPKGLAAMPDAVPFGPGHLLRPLLDVSRSELTAYARAQGLTWVEDPTNADMRLDRNFIRHRVLPVLAERWPGYGATLARAAGHCAEAQKLTESLAERTLADVQGVRPGTLSIPGLRHLDPALARSVLRRWLVGLGVPPPDTRNLARIRDEVLTARADASPLVAWPGCEVRRYRDDLFGMPPLPPRPDRAPVPWTRGELELPDDLGRLTLTGADGDCVDPVALACEGIAVRFGLSGSTCRSRWDGRRRRLKKLFQEAGIASWLRPYVPLLFAGEALIGVGDWYICAIQREGGQSRFRVCWEGGIRSHPGFPSQGPVHA